MRPADPRHVLRDLGRRIAELRKAGGLTQAELAELADVSVKYVQRVEAGRENLTVRSLVWLANLLGTATPGLFKLPRSRKVRTGRPPAVGSR